MALPFLLLPIAQALRTRGRKSISNPSMLVSVSVKTAGLAGLPNILIATINNQ